MGRTWTYGSPVDNDIKKDGKWWATAISNSEALKIVDQLAAYEARIADLEAEIKTWQANDHNQTKAIDLLRKDAERIDDLEKDFAEIQHIMGCNHEDMHRCVSTMEQEFAETKAELARVKAESLRVVADPAGEWMMTPAGLGWYGADATGSPCIETPHGYYDSDRCEPVRIERWED